MDKIRALTIFRWIVSAILCVIIIASVDFYTLYSAVSTIPLLSVSVVLIIAIVNQYVCAIKQAIILSPYAVPLPAAVRFTFISTFFNAILPSGVGGDVVRALYINKLVGSKGVSALAVIFDRLINILIQILVVLISFAVLSGAISTQAGRASSIAALCVFFGIIYIHFRGFVANEPSGLIRWLLNIVQFSSASREKIRLFAKSFSQNAANLFAIYGLSLVYNGLIIAMTMILTTALGGHLTFFQAALIVFAGSIGSFLPISVGGLGIVEGIYTVLFGLLNNQKDIGFAVSICTRLSLVLPILIGGALFAFCKRSKPTQSLGGKGADQS